jgi:hypothetical protein
MHPSGCGRSGGRVVEGARLESEYTAKPYRGFESLPLRQLIVLPDPLLSRKSLEHRGYRANLAANVH